MKRDIGYIGLGKMGIAQVERLLEKGYPVVAWNRSEGPRKEAKKAGAEVSDTIEGVCARLTAPRLLWLMVPHAAVEDVLKKLKPCLLKGDTVIDGGNSFYKDSMRRAKELSRKGINFLDCGTSGGPSGARHGACLMVGGKKSIFERYEPLFRDLARDNIYSNVLQNIGIDAGGYAYVGKSGAGHFAKMVHNGIEYGMMQSLAEGFAILRAADKRGLTETQMDADRGTDKRRRRRLGFNLRQIAELYNKGSVIESRLVGWLAKAFKEHGENLKDVSGEVAHSGEGLWTVQTAKELGVQVKVIEDSLKFRLTSKDNPTFTGRILSAMRNQFGGHKITRT